MVDRIASASPGRDVLDVGCGTGIAARQFQAAGCRVLGVDVDQRMAEHARQTGLDVEVATFEAWDSAGRDFDLVIAAEAWHWVDPVVGATRAAQVLRRHGRLAVFWSAPQPSTDLAEAFAAVHRRLTPDLPFTPWAVPALEAFAPVLSRAADGMQQAGGFGAPEQWRFDWEHTYSRDAWLEQLPTHGGLTRLPPARLADVLAGIGAAIDAAGGSITMRYATIAVTAAKR